MEQEPVKALELDDNEYEREYEGRYGGRRITAGPIIAIAVVIIILFGVGFYFFYGTSVESITVIRAEEFTGSDNQYQGVEIEVRVFSGGAQSINGDGTLDIIHDGETVYTANHGVRDNNALIKVDYADFAIKNGYYEIRFSMEGRSDLLDNHYYVRHVPHELRVEFTSVFDEGSREERKIILVTPRIEVEAGTRNALVEYYNKHYTISITTENPFGEISTETKSMYEWHRNMSTLQIDVSDNIMGNYTVTARFDNFLVKDASPYSSLISDKEGKTAFINRAPVMGRIDHSPSRVSRGNQMELEMRATDPDLNGGIEYFIVDWGDPNYEDLDVIHVGGGKSEKATATHIYNQIGTYIITIIAGDNGYIDDSDPYNVTSEKKFSEISYEINVVLI